MTRLSQLSQVSYQLDGGSYLTDVLFMQPQKHVKRINPKQCNLSKDLAHDRLKREKEI